MPVCLNKNFHVFHHDRIVTFCQERKIGLHKGCAPQLHVGSPRTCTNAPRISNAKSLIRKFRFLLAQYTRVSRYSNCCKRLVWTVMYSQYVFVGVPLQLHTARIACWFSKATTHWSNFCTRDDIDSQTVLRTIRESKMSIFQTIRDKIPWEFAENQTAV